MDKLNRVLSGFSSLLQQRITGLIEASPSPAMAQANFLRLMESSSTRTLRKIPDNHLPSLFRLLGGSASLSDLLVRQGSAWNDFFLRQIDLPQKGTEEHLKELALLFGPGDSLEHLARGLRRHKQ